MPKAIQADRPSVDLAALYAQNQDFVAWLEIPGTNVNHPVVSTGNPDYYLHHTFSGKESAVGTLFSLAADYQTPSQNIAVYGHHLRSSGEKMFTSLMRYKDPDFYAGHETVYLDTLYRGGAYKIFAVVNIHSGEWNPAAITRQTNPRRLAPEKVCSGAAIFTKNGHQKALAASNFVWRSILDACHGIIECVTTIPPNGFE